MPPKPPHQGLHQFARTAAIFLLPMGLTFLLNALALADHADDDFRLSELGRQFLLNMVLGASFTSGGLMMAAVAFYHRKIRG